MKKILFLYILLCASCHQHNQMSDYVEESLDIHNQTYDSIMSFSDKVISTLEQSDYNDASSIEARIIFNNIDVALKLDEQKQLPPSDYTNEW